MSLIAFKPHGGAVCRIVTAKKDGLDSQAPAGNWMVLDRHPSAGCWWLLPSDSVARRWAAEHPDEAKAMFRHASRLVSVRES